MLGLDTLQEIFATIKQNKLRTFLTGFSISWGIFMLIILLGSGNGLKNGITSNFSNRAKNRISIWPGWTSKPYKGFPTSRRIKFTNDDLNYIKNFVPDVTHISGRIYRTVTASYGEEYSSPSLNGIHPDYLYMNNLQITEGRFVNEVDLEKQRKVVIVDEDLKNTTFKGESPINKYLKINNLIFKVVGVYTDEGGSSSNPILIPFSTAQMLYNPNKELGRIDFCIGIDFKSQEESDAYIQNFRNMIGAMHNFNGDDFSALHIWNTAEDSMQANTIFTIVTMFLWVVGIMSLMAGIVGVSNIMLITVKERTREFGIRKALGAKPTSILKLVLLESIFITGSFGYVGMILGIGLTEIASYVLRMGVSASSNEPKIFSDPTVDLGVVFSATILLLVAGTIAAYVPAKRAVSVSPIEAMRNE